MVRTRIGSPAWSALVGVLSTLCSATITPGILEIDLIFPRNDTYAPVALVPIVFAVQNPALAAALNAQISFTVWPIGNRTLSDNDDGPGTFDLQWLNASAVSDPYLATKSIDTFAGIEGTWVLAWSLSTANCSSSESDVSGDIQDNHIIFTTSNAAPAPDLATAMTAQTCAATESFTFNVTGAIPQAPSLPNSQASCALVATGPAPTPNPCAVTINAAAASSIASAATSAVCAYPSHANVNITCPASPTTRVSSARGMYHERTGSWLLVPTLASLLNFVFLQ